MVMGSMICQFVWIADLQLFLPKSWQGERVIGFFWVCDLVWGFCGYDCDGDSCLVFWVDLVFLERNWAICDSNGDKLSWLCDSNFMMFNHAWNDPLLVVDFVTPWLRIVTHRGYFRNVPSMSSSRSFLSFVTFMRKHIPSLYNQNNFGIRKSITLRFYMIALFTSHSFLQAIICTHIRYYIFWSHNRSIPNSATVDIHKML